MKTIKLLAMLIAVFGIYSCETTPKQTKVEVEVGDFKGRLYVNVLNKTYDIYKDSTGVATLNLDILQEPCIGSVQIGPHTKEIFLEPGDHVRIIKKGRYGIHFEGDQSAVNLFINERIPFDIEPEAYQYSCSEFMKAFDGALQTYAKRIDSSPELEHCSALLKQNRTYHQWYMVIIKYFNAKENLSAEERTVLQQFLQEQNSSASRYIKSNGAIERCIGVLYESDEPGFRDYSWNDGTLIKLNWLDKNVLDKTIKQAFVHTAVDTYINYSGIDIGDEIFKRYKEIVDDKALLDKFNAQIDNFKRMSRGSEIPEFKFLDLNGQTRQFDEFKGKYVYIDLWATWCGPCKAQFPYLKELKKEYKDKNIVFLGLNTDMQMSYFTNFIEKNGSIGEQWYIGRNKDFDKFFEVYHQPRFILLDPQGKIYDAHMIRADQKPELINYLNKLEGI